MKDSSVSRWMGVIAIVIVVAVLISFGPLTSGSPGENASGISVAHWYNGHSAQNWVAIYLVGFAIALLLVYLTQLRSVLRDTSGQRLWANVTFAAGILFIASFLAAGTVQVMLILASHNHEFAIAKTFNFFSDNNELGIIFGISVLGLASGLSMLLNREGSMPKLLGWYSILVGVLAVLGPLGFLDFMFGFPIWLIATGFVIATKARRGTLGEKPVPPAPAGPRVGAAADPPAVVTN